MRLTFFRGKRSLKNRNMEGAFFSKAVWRRVQTGKIARDVTMGKFLVRPLWWLGRICSPWVEVSGNFGVTAVALVECGYVPGFYFVCFLRKNEILHSKQGTKLKWLTGDQPRSVQVIKLFTLFLHHYWNSANNYEFYTFLPLIWHPWQPRVCYASLNLP